MIEFFISYFRMLFPNQITQMEVVIILAFVIFSWWVSKLSRQETETQNAKRASLYETFVFPAYVLLKKQQSARISTEDFEKEFSELYINWGSKIRIDIDSFVYYTLKKPMDLWMQGEKSAKDLLPLFEKARDRLSNQMDFHLVKEFVTVISWMLKKTGWIMFMAVVIITVTALLYAIFRYVYDHPLFVKWILIVEGIIVTSALIWIGILAIQEWKRRRT